MLKNECCRLRRSGRDTCITLALILLALTVASAQTPKENSYFARVNTLGVFSAYSNDSSHMLLGYAENRKLLSFGVSYSRRLILNRKINWQYNAELIPVAVESDPVVHYVFHETSPFVFTFDDDRLQPQACVPQSGSYSYTYGDGTTLSYTFTATCKRRWVMGEAMSPAGLQLNLLPRRKTQPFIDVHGGYMYSTQPIPVTSAGSFNFTFDLGAGIEIYRSKTRSIRAEYRYHHISDKNMASANPGIDSGILQITYALGR